MNDYYLLMQGSKVGPVSIEIVSEYLATGKISSNQMVSVNNDEFIRLYEVEGFGHLAPVVRLEEKKVVATDVQVSEKLKSNLADGKFVLILANMGLFAVFMVFNFYKFSPGHFGVWSQLLLVAIYTLILCELISCDRVKRFLEIVSYILLSLMWSTVLLRVLQ